MTSQEPLKKNAGARIIFPIFYETGGLVSGASGLDSEYSLDGSTTFSDCTHEAIEIPTNSGMYYLDLEAGETNGDVVAIIVKTTTPEALTTPLVFYTSAQTLNEIDAVIDAIKVKTDQLIFTSSNVHSRVIAKSSSVALSSQEKLDVNAEVDTSLNTAIPVSPTTDSINYIVELILKMVYNRMKIESNQQKHYEDNGVDVIRTFNLKDGAGNPTMVAVMERDPV